MSSTRFLGAVASVGFLASLFVHVPTFWGVSIPDLFPAVWLLHAGVFIVFAPLVFVLAAARKEGRLRSVFASFPPWVIALAFLLQIYTVVVAFGAFAVSQGIAEERPSGYALINHGELVRELTYEEYRHARALESRGFSSGWLMFYGASALFWLFRRKEAA